MIADDGVLRTRGALGAIAASPEATASRLYDSVPEWNSLGRSCNLTVLSPIFYCVRQPFFEVNSIKGGPVRPSVQRMAGEAAREPRRGKRNGGENATA